MMEGWVAVLVLHVVCAALYVGLPCKETPGYVCDRDGKPFMYKLNGLRVLVIVVASFLLAARLGLVSPAFFVDEFWSVAVASNVLGLLASVLALVLGLQLSPQERESHRRRTFTVDQFKPRGATPGSSSRSHGHPSSPITSRHTATGTGAGTGTGTGTDTAPEGQHGLAKVLTDFFSGVQFNPRTFGLDWKMYSYVYGAVLLELVLLSATSAHMRATGDGHVQVAMAAYVGLFSWFVAEYLYFEHVHLYTYDLFAERLGFKLVWGCWALYPLFYPIGVWPLITPPTADADLSVLQAAGVVALFFFGWVLTRGANLQKYTFKVDPQQPFLGVIQPHTISDTRILYSGFWGLARHINYLGEILQSVALALPGWLLTGSWLPWLYPLYYVLLLVPRQWELDLAVDGDEAASEFPEAARALRAADIVVHGAGVMSFFPATAADTDYMQRVNVNGTRTVTRLMRPGKSALLYISSTEAMGACTDCDEAAPARPWCAYGATKLAAEAVVRAETKDRAISHAILRLTGVMGPGDDFSLYQLMLAVHLGLLPFTVGAGDAALMYTHVDDAVQGVRLAMLAAAAEHHCSVPDTMHLSTHNTDASSRRGGGTAVTIDATPHRPTVALPMGSTATSALASTRAMNRTFIIAPGDALTVHGWISHIARQFGRQPPLLPLPPPLVRTLMEALDPVMNAFVRAPFLFKAEMIDRMLENRTYSAASAQHHLGYRPIYTCAAAVENTAAWYLAQGWLTATPLSLVEVILAVIITACVLLPRVCCCRACGRSTPSSHIHPKGD
ncbi:ergosterol biosynthesis ERG4/ERG24 family protein [Salpingoeca rosetta]|uniref:Ergosterol biosynthesis ERG4/ERG24 family protein n=1 Tax=Salpingoeca rosetta (strain ATCC 50818 / BSB-021) TaxID=946362 RepID=F2U813_SALR5|nr:ergosterol biosynthesis ERG4/ERG24 family protein [Salpingoeca rosetta]EGD72918.1 ergosterol biosynthesis ERG4/ERG24 family protein [Salpingoeca rosetta]|eukprot:XP_004994740.1 ergosterol biosynthesis ERG4/ERG24 family protein [Salpingoeca rosetta]